jgi:aryl-alcohol dehydrogenase
MAIEVTAAVLRGFRQPFVLETLRLEAPRDDEILVRMHSVGICHTDVKITHGYLPVPLPVVLGHEGAGVVEAVGGAVHGIGIGDPVVLSFSACGACPACRQSHPAYCDQAAALTFSCRRPSDGGTPLRAADGPVQGYFFGQSSFATHAITTAATVVRLPRDVPLWLPGVLGCGVQTGAGTVLNVLRPAAGESLAVFGSGTVGLSAVMAARLRGVAPLIAIDLLPQRLALARELGATHTVLAGPGTDVPGALRAATAGRGVHYSLDTTNDPVVVRQAFESLGPRGTYAHVGGGGKDLVFPGSHLLPGRTITGVVQGDSHPQTFIPQLLDWQRRGEFPFERLITRYPFTAINAAVADMEAGRCIKPVLVFDQTAMP